MPISEGRRKNAKEVLLKKEIPLMDEVVNVPEFSMITRDFTQDQRPIHSEVSNCILLEICNKSPDNKRTKFSLTHIPQAMAYAEQKEFDNIIARSVEEFKKIGGNVDEAQIRIYGGNSESPFYTTLHSYTKGAVEKSTGKIATSPSGHSNLKFESTEYYFLQDSIIFIKDDLRRIGPEEGIIATSKILHKDDQLTRLQKVDAFADYHNAVVKEAQEKEYFKERRGLSGKIIDTIKDIKKLSITNEEKLRMIRGIIPREFLDISQITRVGQASLKSDNPIGEGSSPVKSPEVSDAAVALGGAKESATQKLYL